MVEVVSFDRLRMSADHGEPVEPRAKVRDWIEGDARPVWVLYPDTRTVEVASSLQERLTPLAIRFDGRDVLLGFACPVAELVELP